MVDLLLTRGAQPNLPDDPPLGHPPRLVHPPRPHPDRRTPEKERRRLTQRPHQSTSPGAIATTGQQHYPPRQTRASTSASDNH
jgi:hypothetical protein